MKEHEIRMSILDEHGEEISVSICSSTQREEMIEQLNIRVFDVMYERMIEQIKNNRNA